MRDLYIWQFSHFIKREEEFIYDLLELDEGIAKNSLLKENVFLLFISVITKIPLIIIGKLGSGKSLSAELIYKSLRGKYSKEKFFRKFPPLIQTYFQGSESTNTKDVETLFKIAENKCKYFIEEKDIKKEDFPISMILFNELGLAKKSETFPLNILNSKLDYISNNADISFIGISNYTLDATNINRTLILSVPNFEDMIDELILTSETIIRSISEDLSRNQKEVFYNMIKAYYEYKQTIIFLKELTVLKTFNLINKESIDPIDLLHKELREIKRMKVYFDLFKKEKKNKSRFSWQS